MGRASRPPPLERLRAAGRGRPEGGRVSAGVSGPGPGNRTGGCSTSRGFRPRRPGSDVQAVALQLLRRDPVGATALGPDQLAGDPDGVLAVLFGRPVTGDDRLEGGGELARE